MPECVFGILKPFNLGESYLFPGQSDLYEYIFFQIIIDVPV